MGTTGLVVEMVIIGFQVLIWITLIVFTLFDYSWIEPTKLKDWGNLLSLCAIGISYTLGIVFDNFVNTLFAHWEFRSSRWIDKKLDVSPSQMRAYIIATNSDASADITRMANRTRLVRATSLNLILISVSSLVFLVARFGWLWQQAFVIVILSVLLTILAIYAWIRSIRGYFFYLVEFYNTLRKSNSQEEQKPQKQS